MITYLIIKETMYYVALVNDFEIIPNLGIQKAPIMPPMISRYLKPQNPFCIPALIS